MNLLIAIISDSFDRILNTMKISDSLAKIDLILEIYNFMWWKLAKSDQKYMQVCKEYTNAEELFSWEGKVKALLVRIKKFEKIFERETKKSRIMMLELFG